jgi:hypothetical protein
VGDDFFSAHADAGVADGERARSAIRIQADFKPDITFKQVVPGERFVAQTIECVGRIGNQLPQKDVLSCVEGVNHQVE